MSDNVLGTATNAAEDPLKTLEDMPDPTIPETNVADPSNDGVDPSTINVEAGGICEDIVAATAAAPSMDTNHNESPPVPNNNSTTNDTAEPSAACTDTMIAEATAAAIEAAAIDVSAATNAAVLAASAASLVDAANVPDGMQPAGASPLTLAAAKKNADRRKRYREKNLEESLGDGMNQASVEHHHASFSDTDEAHKKVHLADGSAVVTDGGDGSHADGMVNVHEDLLASRRLKDRQRYAGMTPEQRQAYNTKRREQYHRQSEISRQRRRERERNRYHALDADDAKGRNARRAKLERERYQKLTQADLEAKNRRRRERAALARQKKEAEKLAAQGIIMESTPTISDASVPIETAQGDGTEIATASIAEPQDEKTKEAEAVPPASDLNNIVDV